MVIVGKQTQVTISSVILGDNGIPYPSISLTLYFSEIKHFPVLECVL